MKHVFLIPGVLLFSFVLLSTTGFVDTQPFYGEYRPILMKRSDLEKSVSYHPDGRALTNPGKIYSHPPYIYINERYKGIHIINNADPRNPVQEGFVAAPGCIDLAVKDRILYIDNAVDLVAFDLNAGKVTQRIKNVFPQPPAPDNTTYIGPDHDLIVVEWKKNLSL